MPTQRKNRAAQRLAALRKRHGGPPRKWYACPWCDLDYTARQIQKHVTRCAKRPAPRSEPRAGKVGGEA